MVGRWFSLLVAVLALLCSLCVMSNAAVISIDLGSEWIKVALVKVSQPFCQSENQPSANLYGFALAWSLFRSVLNL